MRPRQQLAGGLAPVVEQFERHDVDVRRDLENAIGRGVDDGPAVLKVLLPQLGDDGRTGGGLVAQHPPPDPLPEGGKDLLRKALGIGGESMFGDQPHVLPVPDRGVLAGG